MISDSHNLFIIYYLVFIIYFEKREKEQKKNIRHKEKEKFLSLDQVDSSLVLTCDGYFGWGKRHLLKSQQQRRALERDENNLS